MAGACEYDYTKDLCGVCDGENDCVGCMVESALNYDLSFSIPCEDCGLETAGNCAEDVDCECIFNPTWYVNGADGIGDDECQNEGDIICGNFDTFRKLLIGPRKET